MLPCDDRPCDLAETGRRAAALVLPGADWVHRRVQRISYEEVGLQRMQLSVDFTVPEGEIGTHLPISVLPKWPPLYRFDFHDAAGESVPLLTTEQNGEADEALLRALVTAVSPATLTDPVAEKALKSLTCGPETDLEPSFYALIDRLSVSDYDDRAERLVEIAASLTDTTLLWFPVGSLRAGQRTVVKVEYLIRDEHAHKLWRKVARSLSWQQPPRYIRLWHAGADANYHVDVEAPPTLITREAEVGYYRYIPAWADEEAVLAKDEEISARAEERGLRPDQFLDFSGRLAHLYVTGRRPLAADLKLRFAPTRTGVVLSSFLAALMISILVSFFYCWREWAAETDRVDASVAILVLVPALIGYLLVRTTDHPMIRAHIVGLQLVSLAAAAVPLAMAVTLIRYAGDSHCLEAIWCWLLVASWAFVAILGGGLLGAGTPLRSGDPDDHDH